MDPSAVVEVKKADLDQKRDETSRILEGLGLPEQAPPPGRQTLCIKSEGYSMDRNFSIQKLYLGCAPCEIDFSQKFPKRTALMRGLTP